MTKRKVTRDELRRLRQELAAFPTSEQGEPPDEDRLAERAEEVEALAQDLKQQDALIEPYVSDAGLAEEYEIVRKSQSRHTDAHATSSHDREGLTRQWKQRRGLEYAL